MDTKKPARLADALEWASLVVTIAAIVTYIATGNALYALVAFSPAIPMRLVTMRMEKDKVDAWLLIVMLATALLLLLVSFDR